MTVHVPAELVAELERLAKQKQVSVDEVVREACLAYTEPYEWERIYKEWLLTHPEQKRTEFGIDGDELNPPQSGAQSA